MMNDDFRTQHHRDELLNVKERVLGHVEQDSGDGLSEKEFLAYEIASTRKNRRAQSLPLLVCGGLLAAFSPGAATVLTKCFALGLGLICVGLGLWLLTKHTQRLKELQKRSGTA